MSSFEMKCPFCQRKCDMAEAAPGLVGEVRALRHDYNNMKTVQGWQSDQLRKLMDPSRPQPRPRRIDVRPLGED